MSSLWAESVRLFTSVSSEPVRGTSLHILGYCKWLLNDWMAHTTLRIFNSGKEFGGKGVMWHEEIYLWISNRVWKKKSPRCYHLFHLFWSRLGAKMDAERLWCFRSSRVVPLPFLSIQLTFIENWRDESPCGRISVSHKDGYIWSPRVWSVAHKQHFIFKNLLVN